MWSVDLTVILAGDMLVWPVLLAGDIKVWSVDWTGLLAGDIMVWPVLFFFSFLKVFFLLSRVCAFFNV